jgi:hypothetical protein
MLRSLVTSATDKAKGKEEKKVAKQFFQSLDARMESKQMPQREHVPQEDRERRAKAADASKTLAALAKDDEYCPGKKDTATPKTADELLAERKRAMAEHEREMEKKRLMNLERLRIEEEKKRPKGALQARASMGIDREEGQLGKRKERPSLKSLHESVGYNPLASQSTLPAKQKPQHATSQKNDPSDDPRFQFSLKLPDSQPKHTVQPSKPIAYNPLQPNKPVGIRLLIQKDML